MKKVPFILFVVVFVTSICFAEETSAPSNTDNSTNPVQASSNVSASAQVPSTTVVPTQLSDSATPSTSAKTITFTGKVDSVSIGNSMSGANPQITVKDDSGKLTIFMVASDTTIIGKRGKAITLSWIGKNDKVTIEYTTAQNETKTVKSIKVSPDW